MKKRTTNKALSERGVLAYPFGKNAIRDELTAIGAVMQNDRLFQGDIYSNIVISAPHLSESEAWRAAEVADIADDIRKSLWACTP